MSVAKSRINNLMTWLLCVGVSSTAFSQLPVISPLQAIRLTLIKVRLQPLLSRLYLWNCCWGQ